MHTYGSDDKAVTMTAHDYTTIRIVLGVIRNIVYSFMKTNEFDFCILVSPRSRSDIVLVNKCPCCTCRCVTRCKLSTSC